MVTQLKEVLKNLCSNNGWSYAVFWRVNPRNSMLLTLEDAYYDEKVRILIEKMSQQAHIMGEGIIGEVAVTGKDRWMFSDTYCGKWNSVDSQIVFQDNSEFYRQFSSGIETIVVISVAPLGVIQFGSTQRIPERLEFANQIKSLFQHLGRIDELLLSGNAPSVLNSEMYDPSGFLPSAVDFENYYSSCGASNDHIRRTQTAKTLSLPLPFTSGLYNAAGMGSSANQSSFNHKHQFQPAQVILSTPKLELPHPSLTQSFATKNHPRMSALTSFEQQLLSGTGMQGSQNIFPSNPESIVPCGNRFQNFQEDSIITALHNLQGSSAPSSTVNNARSVDAGRTTGYGTANAAFPTHARPTMPQWSSQQLEQGNERLPAVTNGNLAQVGGVAPSGLVEAEIFDTIPVNFSATSMQNSISTLDSRNACDEKEKSLNVPMQLPIDSNLFDNMEFDFSCGIEKECWDDILMPANNSSNPILSSGISGCLSNLEVGSQADYFADFSVENLFNEIVGNPFSDTKPKTEEQLSESIVTRTGGASEYMNQVQSSSISCLGESMDTFAAKSNPEKMEKSDMNTTCKENLVKSQLGAWVEDSYSINSGSAVTTNSKEPGQQGKVARKRARPGESTRPRPKDRQLIQDRVKELREIVPNGAKCSIDSLLDRTIKHMLFLQGVTKYSDTLKQAEEPKIISEDNDVVLKENSNLGGGATWAFEVAGKSMFCPILVEDLSSKGQMLVEMLCEERGFFLEIADKIRGFGLTIVKGVMEARNDKIWARFIVEVQAHREVTRMDVFLSLANLLQQTETTGINSSKQQQPTKVLDSIIPHLKEYQQNLQCYSQSV
ncbi:hypothetical protein MKW98_020510 [Papaver atlanticum]|uniref:BHLH domain-containing protein n=1 Tax=Papaver atlanticum TaxID=357466 RepID=A0AAD4XT23_9MAGN|nr:hypothetical protein MKW98_007104 [Papaver atlanticum]KAI3940992.1 hypothetical protein MKW98_020510 [Papaver atlanticum]